LLNEIVLQKLILQLLLFLLTLTLISLSFVTKIAKIQGNFPAKTASSFISFSTNILSLAGQLQQEQASKRKSIEQEY